MRARSHFIVLLPLMLLAWGAAGCVMPAGSSLDATVIAQALPSFTPPATDIPPTPTETPEPVVAQAATEALAPTPTPTPDIAFDFVTATLTPQVVAALPTDTPIPTETPQVSSCCRTTTFNNSLNRFGRRQPPSSYCKIPVSGSKIL